MAGFVMRKDHRFKKLVPMLYLGEEVAGEGMIEDLSLSGSYVAGYAPVSVGMALALKLFIPGDPEPLLIDRAIVQWVKGSEFGVEFRSPQQKAVERLTTVISHFLETEYCSYHNEKKTRQVVGQTMGQY